MKFPTLHIHPLSAHEYNINPENIEHLMAARPRTRACVVKRLSYILHADSERQRGEIRSTCKSPLFPSPSKKKTNSIADETYGAVRSGLINGERNGGIRVRDRKKRGRFSPLAVNFSGNNRFRLQALLATPPVTATPVRNSATPLKNLTTH